MRTPKGFRFGGIASGIKPQRRDLALLVSDVPAAAAGVFTVSKAAAAPVLDARPRVPAEGVRAIVANSGNANALTGPAGVEDVQAIRVAAAQALGVQKRAVLTASTGVIGARLPVQKIVEALPPLVAQLGADRAEQAAEAIMTSDTRTKMASREVTLGGKTAVLSAVCKGSGMIAPQLATVLCFVATDAAITPKALSAALARAVEGSFHMVNVDGDMSTNDTVYALANGLAGNARISEPGDDLEVFENALADLCGEMARAIAMDGEGASRMLEVVLRGAPSEESARDCARAIAGSPLVKAAVFGADPNWGRVLATVGARAGSQHWPIDPYRARVSIQGVPVYAGAPVDHDREALRARMREPRVDVLVELQDGDAAATAWGCDLSYDYVKINADYASTIFQRPDGGVARDDRVANYSPAFKRTLLVEALKYIAAFSGQVAVIKYGGAAMVKESLKAAFADDVTLLKRVGLKPVVVHGGAPEITRTLERLGERSEFVDDLRITDAANLPIVEMVLSGKVNQELVALLNAKDAGAVGLSGKDGQLVRARKIAHESGRDLGYVGEVASVNADFLRMLLDKGYVPVISPISLGEDGQSLSVNADDVAAHLAVALGARKLIFLTDVPGILESSPDGELVRQVTAEDLERRIEAGSIVSGMKTKARCILEALAGGVERVHVLDGRQPHTVIAELFTDRGVGTLVTR